MAHFLVQSLRISANDSGFSVWNDGNVQLGYLTALQLYRNYEEITMSLMAKDKAKIVQEYKQSEADTGSPEVQVAILTARIRRLTEHFKKHKHDHHSRRGLLQLVSNRRKHLSYLKHRDLPRYRDLIKRLELRS